MRFCSDYSSWRFHSLFLLLVIVKLAGASSLINNKDCTRSCGKLDGLSYPFRIQGDPSYCGEADYKLICQGNQSEEAVLFLDGHKYFVTEFSSKNYYGGYITVHVDCPFTATTSSCRLQPNSSIHNFTTNALYVASGKGFSQPQVWASFISCSRRIENEKYMVVPSLSSQNTSVYVTVGESANAVISLYESCRFLDVFPFSFEFGEIWNSSKEVIDVLQNGFKLYFRYADAIGNQSCWTFATKQSHCDLVSILTGVCPIQPVRDYLFCVHVEREIYHRNTHWIMALEEMLKTLIFIVKGIIRGTIPFRSVLGLFVYVFLVYNCWKNLRPFDAIENFLQKQEVLTLRRFAYADIIAMTRNFKEKLGKGGFGSVYKGELVGGHLVAIKMLDGSKLNGEEFINEVSTIGSVNHVNIVQLVGFCSDGTKRALIYEYMPNGSLDKYIFSSEDDNRFSLSMEKLYSITLGIAKGIFYLHTGCDMQILHFDIKPHNILLDSYFIPKISDFGLAKLYPRGTNNFSISAARGTIGYIAPELISRNFGVISNKSDVYSFGMLLMELVSRRRNVDRRVENSSQVYYPSWIYEQLTCQQVSCFEDITEFGELEKKLYKLAFWCIQMDSSKRPSMGEVVEILQVDVDELKLPPKPFLASTSSITQESSNMSSYPSSWSIRVEHVD